MILADLIFFGLFQIFLYHFLYQRFERYLRSPAKVFPCLCCITQEGFYICWPEIPWVHFNQAAAIVAINPFFVHPPAFPAKIDAYL